MANVYVRSGATGTANGFNWTNAYTTLAAAFAAKAAGDDFWVADDHAETGAAATAISLNSPGTAAAPCRVICANRAGSTPPVSADLRTTATISTTTTGVLGINDGATTSHTYFYGITFTSGTSTNSVALNIGSSTGTSGVTIFDSCALRLGGTSGGTMNFGSTSYGVARKVLLNNTTMQFGSTSSGIVVRSVDWKWQNTASALTGATIPTTLFLNSSPGASTVRINGVDLSAAGSGKSIAPAIAGPMKIILENCKLNASVSAPTTPTDQGGAETYIIRSDSGTSNIRQEKYTYTGTQTTETTIVRTGGANDGTTAVAYKIVTTANAKPYLPFEAYPIAIWNDTTGSAITLTLQGIWGNGSVPNNDEVWMDIEYPGSSATPLSSFATSGRADYLAANSATSAGSGTWGGSTTKFAISKSITPQMKGPIYITVKVAKASTTLYIDPEVIVT